MRATWTTFIGSLRARFVDYTCSADNLISVVVIAIWLWVMTQVVFGAAGVARTISRLFRACPHIWFHMCIRICYVANFVCWGKNFWGTLVCGSLRVPHFLRLKIRLHWNFSLVGWHRIIVLSVENWLLEIILPRSRI